MFCFVPFNVLCIDVLKVHTLYVSYIVGCTAAELMFDLALIHMLTLFIRHQHEHSIFLSLKTMFILMRELPML